MKWFLNMKIGKKLIVSFVLVAILTGISGTFSIINLSNINRDYKEMYNTNGSPLGNLGKMGIDFQVNRLLVRGMIGADESTILEGKQTIVENDALFEQNLNLFEKSLRTEEDKADFNTLKTTAFSYIEQRDKVIELALQSRHDEAQQLVAQNAALSDKLNDIINTIFDQKSLAGEKTMNHLNNQATSTIYILIAIILGATLLALSLGMFISRIISRPINQIVITANEIANGNLDVDINVTTKDEIGLLAQTFAQMVNHLNRVMINIRAASDQVATGAKQMSESSLLLSQGATEQASSVQQLTASLEDISDKIKSNSNLSEQSNELTQVSKQNAMSGDKHMQDMLIAMEDINKSSTSISKIIKVIDDIAFQTNILALNAAVEAARAGQHGKGFAVVAEEVRNLAARSANAAKETTEMIESSINQVGEGMKIASHTATALNEIVANITKMADISSQISHASVDQAAGIQQINQGLAQVSTVIQTNSATSEESAAASEELSSQANMMREQIATFRTKNSVNSQTSLQFSQSLDHAFASVTSSLEPVSITDKEFGKY